MRGECQVYGVPHPPPRPVHRPLNPAQGKSSTSEVVRSSPQPCWFHDILGRCTAAGIERVWLQDIYFSTRYLMCHLLQTLQYPLSAPDDPKPVRSLDLGCGWIPGVELVFDTVEEYCAHRGRGSFGPPLTSTASNSLDAGGQPGVHLQPQTPASSSDVSGRTRANTDTEPNQTLRKVRHSVLV